MERHGITFSTGCVRRLDGDGLATRLTVVGDTIVSYLPRHDRRADQDADHERAVRAQVDDGVEARLPRSI